MSAQSSHIPGKVWLTWQTDSELTGEKHHHPHVHPFCELYFFVEGKCSYMVENGIYDMPPGTVIFTRPGEIHSVRINEPCLYTRFFYQIDPDFLSEIIGREHMRCFFDRPFGERNVLVLPRKSYLACQERVRRDVTMPADSPDRAATLVADLLLNLSEINAAFDRPDTTDAGERYGTLVSNVLAYINSHLGEIRSTSDIASALYVSREYLSRSFSRETGMRLGEYLTERRVSAAKELILGGTSPDEAAEICGFGNYSYFINVFRRKTGVTPGVMRASGAGKSVIRIEPEETKTP